MASGKTKMLQVVPLPYPIGLDFAGEIIEVGSEIKDFSAGQKVYGFNGAGGAASTDLLLDTTKPHALCKIPDAMSMIEAASLPAVAITAELALKHADDFLRSSGGLKGKKVFIPGALSGVGSVALQLAKNEWQCHTITAASTSKIPQIDNYLGEGVVDAVHDYTTTDVVKTVGTSVVDFVFDTTGLAADYLPMLKRGGLCISIARLPPGSALKNEDPDAPKQSRLACIGQNVMDGLDATFRTYCKTRYGVEYRYQRTVPVTEDLDGISRLVEEGKLKAVVGSTKTLKDIEGVKAACMGIFKGTGQLGKFIITMDEGAQG